MKGFLTTFVMLEATGKQIGIFLFVSFDFPYFVPAPGTEKRGSFRGAFCMQKIKNVFSDYLSNICIFVGYIHLNNSRYGKI